MRFRESPFLNPRGRGACAASACAVLSLALVACATPPPTRLHTLMPAQSSSQGPATPTAPVQVVLEPIRIPAQVDQPQWLVRLPDESLALLEQERWASPLQDELRQALLEGLRTRHAIIDAVPGVASPWRVRLELSRFESAPGQGARIEGAWLLSSSDARRPAQRCEWRFAEPAAGGMPALAQAHRRAVARLADALGASLQKLARGEATACPEREGPP
jgi:uncharacterized lipoprotein YmbA